MCHSPQAHSANIRDFKTGFLQPSQLFWETSVSSLHQCSLLNPAFSSVAKPPLNRTIFLIALINELRSWNLWTGTIQYRKQKTFWCWAILRDLLSLLQKPGNKPGNNFPIPAGQMFCTFITNQRCHSAPCTRNHSALQEVNECWAEAHQAPNQTP